MHDIGHGPFSHAFEQFLQTNNSNKIKHEDWTRLFIKEFERELDKNQIKFDILSDIIQKKYKFLGEYNIATDIVTSQLDADRLDYLLRDAHFCGVPYGNPDLLWIINHLTVIQETGKPPRLGFLRKGWPAIEHFLLCRRIMTQNVYLHHKTKFFEKLLVDFLIEISEDQEKNNKKINNNNLKNFLNNASLYRKGKLSSEEFIQENFNYYKTLTDYDIWMLIRDFAIESDSKLSDSNKIAQIIYQRKIHYSFRFEQTCIEAVGFIVENIKEKLGVSNWQIFTVENDTETYEDKHDPILIHDESGEVHRIQKYSYLLSIFGGKREQQSFLAVNRDLWDISKTKDIIKNDLKNYIKFMDAF